MRKKLLCICSLVLVLSISLGSAVSANEQKIKVFLNGELVNFSNQEPTIVDRRTLIPLRGIFEKMGYSVGWDAKTKSCTISNNTQTITMRSGHKGMQVNDQAFMLDVPAQIINNSLMIPLRAVAECTGAVVTWDAPTKAVYINSTSNEMLTISTDDYVTEYTENISGLSTVNILFNTLNSLTDKNYSKKVEMLEKESESAIKSLESTKAKLNEMTVPEEYETFHNNTLEAIDVTIELCELVEKMLDENVAMTYEEASVEIANIMVKADEVNSIMNRTTSELNKSVFK